jgi:anti-sigma B factor antagonist
VLAVLVTDPSRSLDVAVDWLQGVVVLRGELDRDSAHHLVDAVRALGATDHRRWVVDAAEVTWCDAGGLRALAAAHALALASGRQLWLSRRSRCVDRLVVLTGLDQMIADALPPVVPRPVATRPARPGPAGGAGVSCPPAVSVSVEST